MRGVVENIEKRTKFGDEREKEILKTEQHLVMRRKGIILKLWKENFLWTKGNGKNGKEDWSERSNIVKARSDIGSTYK